MQYKYDPPKVPFGFCHCGCGEMTERRRYTHTKSGQFVGDPNQFVAGHQHRVNQRVPEPRVVLRTVKPVKLEPPVPSPPLMCDWEPLPNRIYRCRRCKTRSRVPSEVIIPCDELRAKRVLGDAVARPTAYSGKGYR